MQQTTTSDVETACAALLADPRVTQMLAGLASDAARTVPAPAARVRAGAPP